MTPTGRNATIDTLIENSEAHLYPGVFADVKDGHLDLETGPKAVRVIATTGRGYPINEGKTISGYRGITDVGTTAYWWDFGKEIKAEVIVEKVVGADGYVERVVIQTKSAEYRFNPPDGKYLGKTRR